MMFRIGDKLKRYSNSLGQDRYYVVVDVGQKGVVLANSGRKNPTTFYTTHLGSYKKV